MEMGWDDFFRKHAHVARVVIEPNDVTVYFKRSEEPFPFTSLATDSPVRHDLYDLFGWEI